MKLTVKQLMEATEVVCLILRDQNKIPRRENEPLAGQIVPRPMPGAGRFLLVRMREKLLPEYTAADGQRDAMIAAYDHYPMVPVTGGAEGEVRVSDRPGVPADKVAEFNEAWTKIAAEEIDVAVEPIPFDKLDMGAGVDGCLTPAELMTLGELVRE